MTEAASSEAPAERGAAEDASDAALTETEMEASSKPPSEPGGQDEEESGGAGAGSDMSEESEEGAQ
jgi:hypothetical protein